MPQLLDALDIDRELKASHRAMWALGNYPAVATDIMQELGALLVRSAGVRRLDRVLDVAAGTGNVAIPAALTGARVVASDLTPQLLDSGRQAAEVRGAELEWRLADAEALPFQDNDFDTVLSCVGVMYAPHHQRSADEMLRVLRPGGTLGLLSWTPEGFIGQMFEVMKPYAPALPPGTQPPPLWGNEAHVHSLLGGRVSDLSMQRRRVRVPRFSEPEVLRDYFKANYGPTIATYRAIATDHRRVAELDHDLAQLARHAGAGRRVMEWEYLLLTARKRA